MARVSNREIYKPKAPSMAEREAMEELRGSPKDRTMEDPERGGLDTPTDAQPYALQYVQDDTCIVRTDLGPGRRTFIAAGHYVPRVLKASSGRRRDR
jgi:hypothetical protein